MIIVNNLNLPLDTDFDNLKPIVSRILKLEQNLIYDVKLYKKSVDARKKNDIKFCCSVLFNVKCDEAKVIKKIKNAASFNMPKYEFKTVDKPVAYRTVVVGFGPAGMFAALILAKAGLRPVVYERGADVDTRKKDVENFFTAGILNENSNVHFGEGGAGTFSDGKLNTGIKDSRIRFVLESFYKYGAKENILYDAKPHIGTDILCDVVKNLRNDIIKLGGEVHFNSRVDGIITEDNRLKGIVVNGDTVECQIAIFAIGHSARETFKMLYESGADMEQKPFSAGVRIEHLASDINKAMYGDFADNKALSAADYKLAVHLDNGRGVYTFCMCPGGEVINSSDKNGFIAVNGMSESRRDGINSNSAVLVSVNPEDLSDNVFSGMEFQEKIEKAAYKISDGAVPVTTVGEFVFSKNTPIGRVKPTVKPKYAMADFNEIFPPFICESLKKGIIAFDGKIKGFADCEAVLTAPETRSSSPVRIKRNEDMVSSIYGIYPCGEGAGYAGGITSAAVDGIKVAESIILYCQKTN